MYHASPSICQLNSVTNNQAQEYLRGLPEKDGKENPDHLHQRQNLQQPSPRMVHAEECHTTSFTIQMKMGRTCRKASPYQMGAGSNYVGPLKGQEKQRQAKHQMGRLFQQTNRTTLLQSGEG